MAESFEQAQDWVANNALYAQTTPAPVRCEVPPIDVATADDALLKSHFESLMECLVRVWEPPVTQAGFQIYRPTVTIYDEEISHQVRLGQAAAERVLLRGGPADLLEQHARPGAGAVQREPAGRR